MNPMSVNVKFGPLKITVPVDFELRSPDPTDAVRHMKFLRKLLADKKKPVVNIKVFAYTSQTTLQLLKTVLDELDTKVKKTLNVLLLRPALSRPFSIWDAGQPEVKKYFKAVRETVDKGDAVWGELAVSEHETIDINVEIRKYLCELALKAIIVDDSHGLIGLYNLERHTKLEPESLTSWDFIGHKTELLETHASGRPWQKVLLRWATQRFSTVWSNFCV